MIIHVSWTISHTVDRAIPNRWAIVLYSQGVARHHNVVQQRELSALGYPVYAMQRTIVDKGK